VHLDINLVNNFYDLKDLFYRRARHGLHDIDRPDVATLGLDLQDCATGIALDLAFVVVIGAG
jgi:hypothetical protein